MRFGKCSNCFEYRHLPENALCNTCGQEIVFYLCDSCGHKHLEEQEDLFKKTVGYGRRDSIACGKCDSVKLVKKRKRRANMN